MISHRIPWVLPFFISMIPAALVGVVLSFPSPVQVLRGRLWIIPLVSIVVGFSLFVSFLVTMESPEDYVLVDMVDAGMIVLVCIFYVIRLAHVLTTSPEEQDRRAAGTALRGLVTFGFAAAPFVVIIYFFHAPIPLLVFSPPFAIFLPAAMAWALRASGRPGTPR